MGTSPRYGLETRNLDMKKYPPIYLSMTGFWAADLLFGRGVPNEPAKS